MGVPLGGFDTGDLEGGGVTGALVGRGIVGEPVGSDGQGRSVTGPYKLKGLHGSRLYRMVPRS